MKYSKIRKGDRVKTNFRPGQEMIIRTVINKYKSSDYESGYGVDLSDGGICRCCHQPIGNLCVGIDAAHITELL